MKILVAAITLARNFQRKNYFCLQMYKLLSSHIGNVLSSLTTVDRLVCMCRLHIITIYYKIIEN